MTSPAPHQAIYRRWRAQTFGQMVGQEAVVSTLRNAVRQDRVSHAVLFVGPRGTGKTSLARILAKAVNCTDPQDGDACDRCPSCNAIRDGTSLDLVEIDAASHRGIDAIRDLRERLPYPPGELRRKVYILDEAHQITKDGWNALLKSIEEPPPFVIFMFASTEPAGFPPAILSRLQRYDVRRLTPAEIEGKLRRILEADGRSADPGALALIARLAAGGMRDAESMLDQLLSSAADVIDEAMVRDLLGLVDAEAVDAFVSALVDGDAAAGVALLDRLEDRGRDARVLMDQAIETIRGRLVAGLGDADPDGRIGGLVDAARRLAAIDPDRGGTGGVRLQLELALFEGPRGPRVAPVPVMEISTPRVAAPPASRPAEPSPAEPAAVPGAAMSAPAPAPAGPSGNGSAAGVASPLSLDRLVAAWPDVVALLSRQPAVKQLITTCRPVAFEGAIVTLGFPEEQGFLRDVAERKRASIEAGIREVVGVEVGVRCVVANIELSPLPASGDLVAEARRIFADDLVDVGEVS